MCGLDDGLGEELGAGACVLLGLGEGDGDGDWLAAASCAAEVTAEADSTVVGAPPTSSATTSTARYAVEVRTAVTATQRVMSPTGCARMSPLCPYGVPETVKPSSRATQSPPREPSLTLSRLLTP